MRDKIDELVQEVERLMPKKSSYNQMVAKVEPSKYAGSLGMSNFWWLVMQMGFPKKAITRQMKTALDRFVKEHGASAPKKITAARLDELCDMIEDNYLEGNLSSNGSGWHLNPLFVTHLSNELGLTGDSVKQVLAYMVREGQIEMVVVQQLERSFQVSQFDQSNFFTP